MINTKNPFKEGKARRTADILISFQYLKEQVKDRLTLEEQKGFARCGVFGVLFNEYTPKNLHCQMSIKRNSQEAKVAAVRYLLQQLKRAYVFGRIKDLSIYFDGDLIPDKTIKTLSIK
jgi:hypothetical protein